MEEKYGWPERVVVWLVTLVFIMAGGAKLAGVPEVTAIFERFHLPHWFMLFTAAVEIAGAIGLHFRRSVVGLAAPAMLAITMVVGAGFHLAYDTPPEAVPAIVLAFLALFVLFTRRRRKTMAPA